MPRPSRRDDLMRIALRLFAEHGYAGTSVADIATAAGVTKAAFGYHFPAKDDLLDALAGPLLDALEDVVARHPRFPAWPVGVRALLTDYLEVLMARRDVVAWVDGDKAVLRHPVLGERLAANNRAMRVAIAGDAESAERRTAAAAVLGIFWRPLRNLPEVDPAGGSALTVDLAMTVAAAARSRPLSRRR